MALLTPSMLSNGWEEAKAVQHVLDTKGFWSCDITLAVNRKFAQNLKEQVEINSGGDDGEPAPESYDVECIVSAPRKVSGQERTYVVKWVGYPSSKNTTEPESHLLTCRALPAFWKSKKNAAELARVTKLQNAALREEDEARHRRAQPLQAGVESAPTAAKQTTAAAASTSRPSDVPAVCKAVYDHAHRCLGDAYCLVLDSETGAPQHYSRSYYGSNSWSAELLPFQRSNCCFGPEKGVILVHTVQFYTSAAALGRIQKRSPSFLRWTHLCLRAAPVPSTRCAAHAALAHHVSRHYAHILTACVLGTGMETLTTSTG